MSKIPARCNKRDCQSRRNLSKMPELYVRWPKCHQPGCDGKMYVDKYRMNKGVKDNAPVCHDDCLPFPHRVNTRECKHYEDYIIERSMKPMSKHKPDKLTDDEAPF